MLLVFAAVFSGCKLNGDDGGNAGEASIFDGIWNRDSLQLIVSGSNWTIKTSGLVYLKGKFAANTNSGTLAISASHMWQSDDWAELSTEEKLRYATVVQYNLQNDTLIFSNSTNESKLPMNGTWTKSTADNSPEGNWEKADNPNARLVIQNGVWTAFIDDEPLEKGTVDFTVNQLYMYHTHSYDRDPGEWRPLDDDTASEAVTFSFTVSGNTFGINHLFVDRDMLHDDWWRSGGYYRFFPFLEYYPIDEYREIAVSYNRVNENQIFPSMTKIFNRLQEFGFVGNSAVSSDISVIDASINDLNVLLTAKKMGTSIITIKDDDGHEALIHAKALSNGAVSFYIERCERPVTLTVEYDIKPWDGNKGGSGSFVFDWTLTYFDIGSVGQSFGFSIFNWPWETLLKAMADNGCDIPPDQYGFYGGNIPIDYAQPWTYSVYGVEGEPAIFNFVNAPPLNVPNIVTQEQVTLRIEN